MNKRNWKIIYNKYSGMEKKAVELISKEMGAQILRDQGRYTIHVLSCEKEETAVFDRNAVVLGLYKESEIIQKHINANEIKSDGYVVKVTENNGKKLALITAHTPAALYYGAVDFVDDYFVKAAPKHGALYLADEIFEGDIPDYYNASAPTIKTRSVFTWGHPINDYQDYIENMARLKLNQLIIWNDYAPINAKDVVEYAHEFGIKVIWGFSWGWRRNCAGIDLNEIDFDQLAESIINTYEDQYNGLGDGIYFQSITELKADNFRGKLVAEIVTDFVNRVASRILKKHPGLFLQFGLHATSVKDHLDIISKVDKRIEIMWEDCGSFPYGYIPIVKDENDFNETVKFTHQIFNLREQGGVSVLFKGFMTLDWIGDRFAHQAGPFVLGVSSEQIVEHDRKMLKPIWRRLQSGWLQNGEYAYKMTKHIFEYGNQNVTVGMAGQFAGGIWLPEALCAQILWECDKPYTEIFDKVLKRRCVEIV